MGKQHLMKEPVEITSDRTLRSLVNTPFKKAMFFVQILSYVLIVGSPFIGGLAGKLLHLSAAQTGGFIFVVFIAGEVLFYGSLFFLGKEVVSFLREKMKGWLRRKKVEK
jgi:hypothetical protein